MAILFKGLMSFWGEPKRLRINIIRAYKIKTVIRKPQPEKDIIVYLKYFLRDSSFEVKANIRNIKPVRVPKIDQIVAKTADIMNKIKTRFNKIFIISIKLSITIFYV
jgi:hypothetical protein